MRFLIAIFYDSTPYQAKILRVIMFLSSQKTYSNFSAKVQCFKIRMTFKELGSGVFSQIPLMGQDKTNSQKSRDTVTLMLKTLYSRVHIYVHPQYLPYTTQYKCKLTCYLLIFISICISLFIYFYMYMIVFLQDVNAKKQLYLFFL